MNTHKPAVSYSLDGQIELVIHAHSNQILRTVSFDNGENWLPWRKMKNQKTFRPVGFACTADARTRYLVYQILNPIEGMPYAENFKDNGEYIFKTDGRYGFAWDDESKPMGGNGKFITGPSVICSPSGNRVYIFGIGLNRKLYWARSDNRGIDWLWRWENIGDTLFHAEPCAVMSADGQTIMIFAIGLNDQCFYSRSVNGGSSWDIYCGLINQAKFTSGPSACISADGRDVIVAARRSDNKIWAINSVNGGDSWAGDWAPVLAGVFNGGPGLCATWDLSKTFIFALGTDNKIWKAQRFGKNQPFAGWWPADKEDKLDAI